MSVCLSAGNWSLHIDVIASISSHPSALIIIIIIIYMPKPPDHVGDSIMSLCPV